MAKTKRNIGLEILEGIREIKRGEHGRIVNVPSVSTVRERTGLSQSRFAELLGVSVRTLQEWEQGRRAPSVQPERCSSSRKRIPVRYSKSRSRNLKRRPPSLVSGTSYCIRTSPDSPISGGRPVMAALVIL